MIGRLRWVLRPLRNDPSAASLAGCGVVLAALLLGLCKPAQALVIGRVDADSLQSDITEGIIKEAFERAGLALEFRRLPLVRSAEMANDGEIDGNLNRVADMTRRYPNLIAVPTPINRVDVAIYAANEQIRQRSRSDIEKMKVGITRGVIVLAQHSHGLDVARTESTNAAFDMLKDGRIDVAMLGYLDGEVALLKRQLNGITRWPYVWATEPQYFMLHRKHADLVPRLDEVFRKMKAEGLIDRHYDLALQRRGIPPLPPATGRNAR